MVILAQWLSLTNVNDVMAVSCREGLGAAVPFGVRGGSIFRYPSLSLSFPEKRWLYTIGTVSQSFNA